MSEPPRPDAAAGTPNGDGPPPPIPPPPPERGGAIWIVAALIAALAVVGGVIVWTTRAERTAVPSTGPVTPETLLASAPAQTEAAGCGAVVDVGPYLPPEQDAIHVEQIDMPRLASWPSTPPTSGPHANSTVPAGSYETTPPILPLIHSLEHGAVVVWYAPGSPEAEVARITAFYQDPAVGGHVIIAPYDYPNEGEAGRLPEGFTMALVAWHYEQLCERVNLGAAFGFSADYATPTFRGRPYLGDAPEPSVAI